MRRFGVSAAAFAHVWDDFGQFVECAFQGEPLWVAEFPDRDEESRVREYLLGLVQYAGDQSVAFLVCQHGFRLVNSIYFTAR